jgi:hypothetical protein
MRMRTVMQLIGHGMALCTQALTWLKTQLCKLVSNLRVSFILASQSAVNLCSHLVKILLSFKALLASLIIAVQSIKLALKPVVTISGQIGQQLLTIARQIRQRVKQALSKGK